MIQVLYPDMGYRLSARKTIPYMRPLYLKGNSHD
nr:MAG TPA: hypothetical protein [Caudoviricetes sp.]